MERLFRIVDGEQVFLTEEEEAALRAEWAANELAIQERDAREEQERLAREQAKQDLMQRLGLTEEQFDLLMKTNT